MISYEEFLRTAAVPRQTIDNFLNPQVPTWSRFDGEAGYTLGRSLPRDGIDNSWTVSTSQDNGQRTSWMYAGRPCRLNTYGNSFTQCHQVSDGETWQESLAAHLGEPVRNFGMGGFGTYQAYRRLLRTEQSDLGSEYVILYIWGDDHCRSVMRSRHAATHRVWDDHNGFMFHGNFWANVEMDLDSGSFVERDSLLPIPDALYSMCDPEFMVESLRDDLMVMLYGMDSFAVEGDREKLDRLAEILEVLPIDEASDESRAAGIERLKREYGFAASRYIIDRARRYVEQAGKKMMICLICPTATDEALRGLPRYDQAFVDHLYEQGFLLFDMNEVHRRDYQAFSLSIDDYRKRYWIGHYSPAGNHFFAYSLKDLVVDWLDPKPITYRGETAGAIDFTGYLPAIATTDLR